MQTNWLDVLDLAGDYWELEALQDLCSDCPRVSYEEAQSDQQTTESVPVLSTAESESLGESWMLPCETTSRDPFREKPQRVRWTVEEDTKLAKLAKTFKKNWDQIAEHFPNKPPHLLARRWSKKHDPKVVVGNWTQEEDDLILKLFEVEGNWTQIATHLPGRLPASVKNRFYGTIRKNLPSHVLERIAKRGKWQRLMSSVDGERGTEDSLLNSASTAMMNSLSLEPQAHSSEEQRRERLQVLAARMQTLEVFLNHTKAQIDKLEQETN
jgi:hypothetical protein